MSSVSTPIDIPAPVPAPVPTVPSLITDNGTVPIAYSLKHKPILLFLNEPSREPFKETIKSSKEEGLNSNFSSCASFTSFISSPSSGRSTPLQFQIELEQ